MKGVEEVDVHVRDTGVHGQQEAAFGEVGRGGVELVVVEVGEIRAQRHQAENGHAVARARDRQHVLRHRRRAGGGEAAAGGDTRTRVREGPGLVGMGDASARECKGCGQQDVLELHERSRDSRLWNSPE